jgi:hypothetical protein
MFRMTDPRLFASTAARPGGGREQRKVTMKIFRGIGQLCDLSRLRAGRARPPRRARKPLVQRNFAKRGKLFYIQDKALSRREAKLV